MVREFLKKVRMNARKWLSRYRELMEEVEREYTKAGYWEDKAEGLSSKVLSHAPVHGHGKTMSDCIVEFLDTARHCSELAEDAQTAMKEIEEVIDSLDNTDYRRALRFKYIDNLPYYEVAKRMDYTGGSIRNLLSKAVKEVTQSDIYIRYNVESKTTYAGT